MGAIGVYYLRGAAGRVTVIGRYPDAVKGWGYGAIPTDWRVTDRFTADPAILASGGYTGQGIIESSATLTELRPDGPVTSDVINTGFSPTTIRMQPARSRARSARSCATARSRSRSPARSPRESDT